MSCGRPTLLDEVHEPQFVLCHKLSVCVVSIVTSAIAYITGAVPNSYRTLMFDVDFVEIHPVRVLLLIGIILSLSFTTACARGECPMEDNQYCSHGSVARLEETMGCAAK